MGTLDSYDINNLLNAGVTTDDIGIREFVMEILVVVQLSAIAMVIFIVMKLTLYLMQDYQ